MANFSNENKTNLIVNYLPQMYSDEELEALFGTVGNVKSAKIIRDKNTGYSYGFGFVDFGSPEEADAAIQNLNGYDIQNKRIKVALARPPGENTKNANLYVRNIPAHYTESDLQNLFQAYGVIVQTRVLFNTATGASKGVGFVLFEKKEDADNAMANLNGYTPDDGSEAMMIKFADDNAKKVRAPPEMQGQGYGGGGGGGYGSYGGMEYSRPPRYPGGPMRGSRGGGFRYNPMGTSGNGYGSSGLGGGYSRPPRGGMGSPRARGGMSRGGMSRGGMSRGASVGMGGMGAYQNFAMDEPAGGDAYVNQGHIVFAYNIGYEATEDTLWNMFSPYGAVSKVDIIWDKIKNQCKGFGFVSMPHKEEADYAVSSLNGQYFNGKTLQISFKSNKNL